MKLALYNLLKIFKRSKGMGHIPDTFDSRDHDMNKHSELLTFSEKEPISDSYRIGTSNFTPIKNQGKIGSCTAHAGVAIMEYYIKKRTGTDYDLSEKYLYWVTRRLLNWEKRDTGAYLRTVMQALTRFGVCEEKFSPYDEKFAEKPDCVLNALADDFRAETYLKLDKGDSSKKTIMVNIKKMIRRNYPIVFGFTVYKNTINSKTGEISYPHGIKKVRGGHAVVIIGFDDTRIIGGNKGAFKIRNSWGKNWGDNGYGWLPYEYLYKGDARDFWMIFRADWLKLSKFD